MARNFKPRRCNHGLSNHPLYTVWVGIKLRCNNPQSTSYKWYGGEGVKVCPEWDKSFVAFYEWAMANGYVAPIKGIRNRVSIDRIDSKGDYCPTNCRWTYQHEQVVRQRRNTRNRTGYKGVSFEKVAKKYRSEITVNKHTYFLGYYHSAKEAAIARDNYIIQNNLHEYRLQTLPKGD